MLPAEKDVARAAPLMATQPSGSRIAEIRLRPMVELLFGSDPASSIRKSPLQRNCSFYRRPEATNENTPRGCLNASWGYLSGAKGRNRTGDTSIFSAVLYRLSYLGIASIVGGTGFEPVTSSV
jgi:hypothetical protein